jgi:RNA methyltransferase, TrmH family
VITSVRNSRVAKAARLKKRAMRERDRRFLVEGAQAVQEALAAGARVHDVFSSSPSEGRLEDAARAAAAVGVPVRTVSPEVMAHLTATVTPQGLVAVADFVDVSLPEVGSTASFVPVLVEVRDPGNAGTILRSADAAGADAVVFTRSSVDVYNPKTVRATAGSLFHVPVVRELGVEEAVGELRDRGFAVLAAAADGEVTVYEADLTKPTAVLFGNEARGLSPGTRSLAGASVRVPIAGRAESLNLAAAATIVLFEAARQRAGLALSWAGDSGSDPLAGSLADLVAGAAHDIRSPLTAVRGFVATLINRWNRLTDEQRKVMLEGIAYDGGRMQTIIALLLDAARLASGRLQLAVGPVDLLDAAAKLAEDLRRWSQVEIEVTGERVRARVDPERLRTMLAAMVESAEWWGEEGPVRIMVGGGGSATIDVFRARASLDAEGAAALLRPRGPGTGGGGKIGLSVARALADAQGGSLVATVEDGIRLTLALAPVGAG